VITRKRKKKSDTDEQDKGGGKKTRTNVIGARRSLNIATIITNTTVLVPRDGAKHSASVTTMKTTNNTTATKTVSKGGAKRAANPASAKTN
jgi:hypothetical protein